MKKFCTFIFALFMVFCGNSAFAACTSNQIAVSSSNCKDVYFSLTTVASTTSFQFEISAAGTFYVDCGNSGTLKQGSTTISNKTISRSSTSSTTYTCSWTRGRAQTIRFGGTATSYSVNAATPAITFSGTGSSQQTNVVKIAAVSGNLSSMFPYQPSLGQSGAQPRFYQTFYNATNLTNIPDTLFADYTTPPTYLFWGTFRGCTGLTSMPAGLFAGFSSSYQYLFSIVRICLVLFHQPHFRG